MEKLSTSHTSFEAQHCYSILNRVRVVLVFIAISLIGTCSGNIRVELQMPRYVVRGHNATLQCIHSADPELIYKVEWLRAGHKIFQYVKGRRPPYRNFTFVGAQLDWKNSNNRFITLVNLDFDASDYYSCEVSMETPIYTKESPEEELTVILPQSSEPQITFEKPVYTVGETMIANCTTSPARPPPHITWFINNKKVDEMLVRLLEPSIGTFPHSNGLGGLVAGGGPHYANGAARSVSQLAILVSDLHAGEDGRLELMCVATIPGYLGHDEEYADIHRHGVNIEVVVAEIPSPSGGGESLTNHASMVLCSLAVALVLPSLLHLVFTNLLLPWY